MSESTARYAFSSSVSDGPVVCASCGCRLQGVGPSGSQAWFHFNGARKHDARGCRIECAELAHDRRGRSSVALAS